MKDWFLFLFIFVFLFPFSTLAQQEDLRNLPDVPIGDLLRRLADILFYLLLAIAVIFLLWGGITMVTAAGDTNKFENGKRIILYSLIGVIIGIIAYGLVNLIYSYLSGR